MQHRVRVWGAILSIAGVVLWVAPRAALADPVGCQRTIAKASAKYLQKRHKLLRDCLAERREAGETPGDGLTVCLADTAVATEVDAAAAQMETAIARACGGDDGQCGGDFTGEDLPADIGFPARCPNYGNGSCVNELQDCVGVTSCLRCIGEHAQDELLTQTATAFVDQDPDTGENECQVAITKAVRGFTGKQSKTLRSCWDAVLKAKPNFAAPCPSGDGSGKAESKIAKAEVKLGQLICKACGSSDKAPKDGVCDAPGLDPQSGIGFGVACPAVIAPDGTDCGAIGTVATLQDYVACVRCLSDRGVACADRAAVLGQAPYPGECNPQSTLSLPSGYVVGKNLQISFGGSLGFPAPAGNLQVTLTSAEPSKLLLAKAPTDTGSTSITVQVGAGSSSIPAFYVQGLAEMGSVQVTASAPDYTSGSTSVALQPAGFVVFNGDYATTTIADSTPLQIYAALLDPVTHAYQTTQPVRGGLTVNVGVSSGTPSVAAIVGSPVSFGGNQGYADGIAVDPLAVGSTLVSVDVPPGFTAPTTYGQFTVSVALPPTPNLYFCDDYYHYAVPAVTVGKDLQVSVSICRDQAYLGAADVTVNADGVISTITSDAGLAGGASQPFPGATGNYLGSIVVQGRSLGTTSVTAQAAGHNSGSLAVTVNPSGFVTFTGDYSTTTVAANTPLQIYSAMLDATTHAYAANQPVRGGLTVNVGVSSGTPAVAAIVGSPVSFGPNQSTVGGIEVDALSIGTSLVTVDTPLGFTTPTTYGSLTATVTAPPTPNLYFCDDYYHSYPVPSVSVGKDLQVSLSICRDYGYPDMVDVTVTTDGTIGTISTDPSVAGATSHTFTGVSGTYVGTIVVQGRSLGTTSVTAQSAGHNTGTLPTTVNPSGFVTFTGDFTTQNIAPNTPLTIYSAMLDPSTHTYQTTQPVRGGLTVNVGVSSGTPSVAAIVGSPVSFGANQGYADGIAVDPLALGSTLVSVDVPPGFTAPANYGQLTATVVQPDLYFCTAYYGYYGISAVAVGRDLQVAVGLCRNVNSPVAANVTLTSADGTRSTITLDAALTGSASQPMPSASGSYLGTLFVQGRGLGTTTITAQATGHVDATLSVTVDPAGFVLYSGDFSTSAGATNSQLYVYSARLDSVTANMAEQQPLRGGLSVNVPVSSDAPAVGAVVGSPAAFTANQGYQTVEFDPVAVGTATLTVGTPMGFGFSTPSNYHEVHVTVTP